MTNKPELSEFPRFDAEKLINLANGAQIIFENAENLYREAKILASSGAVSRALFLHQVSLEECAKIEIIGAWCTSLLVGVAVDEREVVKAFSSHAKKNRTNSYMLKPSPKEHSAKEQEDWNTALEAFNEMKEQFHIKSNEAKNSSLYVDFQNGGFVAPADKITPEMLAETAKLNEEFLGIRSINVDMLQKWVAAPESIQETIVPFMQGIKAVRHQSPSDPYAGLQFVNDFFEREFQKQTTRKSEK